MIAAVRAWLRASVPIDLDRFADLTNEPVPGHLKKWWFCLGGTPAYLLLVQLATGVLLSLHYVPETTHAWESVRRITEDVTFGWWVRSLHKWAGQAMIVAVALHMLRVFFTGAYRKPRELNWLVGCSLLVVTLVMGFSGYSLVYEQLSYWGATVATSIAEAVPGVGPWIARALRGGEDVGQPTLTRLFVLHIGILPTVLLALFGLHVVFIRLHGVSDPRPAGEPPGRTFPFIPDHVMTEVAIALVLMTLLSVAAVLFPAEMGPPANPAVTPEHIKPEWYFYFTFRWLKLTSLEVGVAGTTACVLVMFAWPWLDRGLRRASPRVDLSPIFGVLAVLVFLLFTIWEAMA